MDSSLPSLYFQYMQLFIKQSKLVAGNDYRKLDPDYVNDYSNLQRQMYHLSDQIILKESDAINLKE